MSDRVRQLLDKQERSLALRGWRFVIETETVDDELRVHYKGIECVRDTLEAGISEKNMQWMWVERAGNGVTSVGHALYILRELGELRIDEEVKSLELGVCKSRKVIASFEKVTIKEGQLHLFDEKLLIDSVIYSDFAEKIYDSVMAKRHRRTNMHSFVGSMEWFVEYLGQKSLEVTNVVEFESKVDYDNARQQLNFAMVNMYCKETGEYVEVSQKEKGRAMAEIYDLSFMMYSFNRCRAEIDSGKEERVLNIASDWFGYILPSVKKRDLATGTNPKVWGRIYEALGMQEEVKFIEEILCKDEVTINTFCENISDGNNMFETILLYDTGYNIHQSIGDFEDYNFRKGEWRYHKFLNLVDMQLVSILPFNHEQLHRVVGGLSVTYKCFIFRELKRLMCKLGITSKQKLYVMDISQETKGIMELLREFLADFLLLYEKSLHWNFLISSWSDEEADDKVGYLQLELKRVREVLGN